MSRRPFSILILVVVAILSLPSCGQEGQGTSADLEMDVTGGIIIPSENATCADKLEGSGSKSAAKNTLNFSALRLNWLRTDRSLYVALIRFTIRSSRITGGSAVVTLDTAEIEALLGAPGQTIPPLSTGPKAIVSNKPANRQAGSPNCAVNIGGIGLANESITTPFSASVLVELVGFGSGSNDDPEDGSDPYPVRQSYSTTAQYF